MHVADLDGTGLDAGNQWDATVTVTIFDGSLNPVANATVNGTWTGGASGGGSCNTDVGGQCNVMASLIEDAQASVTFTVDSVTQASYSYNAAANGDPDGDSDGTTITIIQPAAAPTPTNTPTPEPTPAASTLHVADLDGSSSKAGKNWDASATITVWDADQNPVTDATVSGSWSTGDSASCTTGASGQCSLILAGLGKTVSSVSFTITDVSHASLTYQAGDNADPDGDSDGTSITVAKP